MADRAPLDYPVFQAFDANGDPLVNGKVEFFDAGTTNNRDTYSDPGLTTANPNPVTLNSRGEPESGGGTPINIYLDASPYKIVLKDSDDVTVRTIDDYLRPDVGESISAPKDPINATDVGTDVFEAVFTDPKSGEVFTIDFQSSNTTTTPTLENTGGSLGALTIKTRDGSALWAGALSGVHTLQLNAGGTAWLVLDSNPVSANSANAGVQRDANGRAKFADPSAAQDAVTYGVLGSEKISSGGLTGASVDITLPSGYSAFFLIINDLAPATNAAELRCRTSADGGSIFDSGASDYQSQEFVASNTTLTGSRSVNDHGKLVNDLADPDGPVTAGIITIHDTGNAGSRTVISSDLGAMASSAGSSIVYRQHKVQRIADQSVTTIRLFFSSGNISQGNYALYGAP